jgi:hypothetical protein
MRQYLVTIFVANQSLQLVVQRVALRVECPHHLVAVNGLGVLELEGAFFFTGDDLVGQIDLTLNFFVFLVGVLADAVLAQIALIILPDLLSYRLMLAGRLVPHLDICLHLFLTKSSVHVH